MDQRLSKPRRFTLAGSIRLFFAESLLIPTGFLIIAILTRWLGPEQYGLYVLAISIVTWLEISFSSIFTHSSILVSSENANIEAVLQTILKVHLAVGVAIGLLLFAAAPTIAQLFQVPELALLLRFLSIDIPLYFFARAYRAIWTGTGEFNHRAYMSLGRWLVRLLLIVFLVMGGLSLWGAIAANIGATLFESLFAFSKKRINPFIRQPNLTSDFVSVVMPLALFAIAMRLFSNLDLLSLRVLGVTLQQVGFYGAALNLAIIPGIVALAYAPMLLSTLNKLRSQGSTKAAFSLSIDALRLGLGLLPFGAMIAGSAVEIVGFVLNEDFADSAPLLRWLIFGAIFQTSFSISTVILMAAHRSRQIATVAILVLVASLIGYIMFIPRFGSIAAAWTITSTSLAAAGIGIFLVYKSWGILPPVSTLLRAIALSVLIGFLSATWMSNGVWIVLEILSLSLLILLGFYASGELNSSEKVQLRKALTDILAPSGN